MKDPSPKWDENEMGRFQHRPDCSWPVAPCVRGCREVAKRNMMQVGWWIVTACVALAIVGALIIEALLA